MKQIFRALAFLLALSAFIIAVVDSTAMVAMRRVAFTTTGDIIFRATDPKIVDRLREGAVRFNPSLAHFLEALITAPPALFMALAAAIAFWRLGRQRTIIDTPRRLNR